MSKKTDVRSPGCGDLRVSARFSSLPTAHTHSAVHPHMYLRNVRKEAPACFDCKHLSSGSGELNRYRWAETVQWSLA